MDRAAHARCGEQGHGDQPDGCPQEERTPGRHTGITVASPPCWWARRGPVEGGSDATWERGSLTGSLLGNSGVRDQHGAGRVFGPGPRTSSRPGRRRAGIGTDRDPPDHLGLPLLLVCILRRTVVRRRVRAHLARTTLESRGANGHRMGTRTQRGCQHHRSGVIVPLTRVRCSC